MALKRIISGAQTGADRAGLDAALLLGLEVGGWIPHGRRTDTGPLSPEDFALYGLKEHTSSAYPPRTENNVRESDGTVLFGNMDSSGSALTIKLCKAYRRPFLCNPTTAELAAWLTANAIETLNVAGNRERTNPGVYQRTFRTLTAEVAEVLITGEWVRR